MLYCTEVEGAQTTLSIEVEWNRVAVKGTNYRRQAMQVISLTVQYPPARRV